MSSQLLSWADEMDLYDECPEEYERVFQESLKKVSYSFVCDETETKNSYVAKALKNIDLINERISSVVLNDERTDEKSISNLQYFKKVLEFDSLLYQIKTDLSISKVEFYVNRIKYFCKFLFDKDFHYVLICNELYSQIQIRINYLIFTINSKCELDESDKEFYNPLIAELELVLNHLIISVDSSPASAIKSVVSSTVFSLTDEIVADVLNININTEAIISIRAYLMAMFNMFEIVSSQETTYMRTMRLNLLFTLLQRFVSETCVYSSIDNRTKLILILTIIHTNVLVFSTEKFIDNIDITKYNAILADLVSNKILGGQFLELFVNLKTDSELMSRRCAEFIVNFSKMIYDFEKVVYQQYVSGITSELHLNITATLDTLAIYLYKLKGVELPNTIPELELPLKDNKCKQCKHEIYDIVRNAGGIDIVSNENYSEFERFKMAILKSECGIRSLKFCIKCHKCFTFSNPIATIFESEKIPEMFYSYCPEVKSKIMAIDFTKNCKTQISECERLMKSHQSINDRALYEVPSNVNDWALVNVNFFKIDGVNQFSITDNNGKQYSSDICSTKAFKLLLEAIGKTSSSDIPSTEDILRSLFVDNTIVYPNAERISYVFLCKREKLSNATIEFLFTKTESGLVFDKVPMISTKQKAIHTNKTIGTYIGFISDNTNNSKCLYIVGKKYQNHIHMTKIHNNMLFDLIVKKYKTQISTEKLLNVLQILKQQNNIELNKSVYTRQETHIKNSWTTVQIDSDSL